MSTNEFQFTDQWNPPVPTDNSQYTFNSVNQTRSGHVFEIDDTPGHERIAEHHKSGTSKTIIADGTSIIDIQGDSWVMIIRDGHIHIKGSAYVTMEQSVKLHCKKLEIETEEMHTTVHGDYSLHVDGNYTLEVVGDVSEKIKGRQITESKDFTHTVHGKVSETVSSGYTSIIKGDYNMTSTGSAHITGGPSGTSLNSSGKVSIGGSLVGIDSLSACNITAVGTITALTPVFFAKTPSILAPNAIVKCLDTMSTLTWPVTLSSHIHLASDIPTTPPIV